MVRFLFISLWTPVTEFTPKFMAVRSEGKRSQSQSTASSRSESYSSRLAFSPAPWEGFAHKVQPPPALALGRNAASEPCAQAGRLPGPPLTRHALRVCRRRRPDRQTARPRDVARTAQPAPTARQSSRRRRLLQSSHRCLQAATRRRRRRAHESRAVRPTARPPRRPRPRAGPRCSGPRPSLRRRWTSLRRLCCRSSSAAA